MSTEPEWVARNVRVEVHYGDKHPYGAVFVDGQMVPFCSRVQVDFVAGEAPKVIITVEPPELAVDMNADVEAGAPSDLAASLQELAAQIALLQDIVRRSDKGLMLS